MDRPFLADPAAVVWALYPEESAVYGRSFAQRDWYRGVSREWRPYMSEVFEGATAEGYWPDHDFLSQRDEAFEFPLPEGSFFDGAMVHLVTTASLERLQATTPGSRFDVTAPAVDGGSPFAIDAAVTRGPKGTLLHLGVDAKGLAVLNLPSGWQVPTIPEL